MSVQPAQAAPPWQQFICRVCGLIYDERLGDSDSGLQAGTRWADIPEDWACPICGVGKADFEPYVPATATATAPRPAQHLDAQRSPRLASARRGDEGVVIVGAGRAGWAVAQALRQQGWQQAITLVSACAGDVYDKPQLSVAVARGLDPMALLRESAAAAAARLDVRLRCSTHAVAIDAPARRLRTTRGTLLYRHLVLAQGAEPALPGVLPAALVWRVNDLPAYQRLRAALATGPQHVAIVGAGLVGCELANDLALAGHRITLMDVQDRPLAAVLPAVASARLLSAWAALPIAFKGGVQVEQVQRVAGGVTERDGVGKGSEGGRIQLRFKDGSALLADHIIAATGLRAAGRLAASAGLAFDSAAGGIVADSQTLATSVEGIYALGDCVVVDGQASRYIEPIARQARGLAAHIQGGPAAPVEAVKAPPVLRVKTSALPITITGALQPGGVWQTERDSAEELRLLRLGPLGQRLGTLVARKSA